MESANRRSHERLSKTGEVTCQEITYPLGLTAEAAVSMLDVSEGGVAVALAESCLFSPTGAGAEILLDEEEVIANLLFGEPGASVVVTFAAGRREEFLELLDEFCRGIPEQERCREPAPGSVKGEGDRLPVPVDQEPPLIAAGCCQHIIEQAVGLGREFRLHEPDGIDPENFRNVHAPRSIRMPCGAVMVPSIFASSWSTSERAK